MKNNPKLSALIFFSLLLVFMPRAVWAQDSSTPIKRLIGTWQLNESKMKVGSGDQGLTFRLDAKGNLEELRGGDANPVAEPVHFDGKSYPVDNDATTIVWKQIDNSHFERTSFNGGKLVLTGHLSLAPDGKTLTEEDDTTLTNDKKEVTTLTLQRSSGDAQGLVGTWKTIAVHESVPPEIKFDAVGPNKIKSTNSSGNTYTAALDNKPVPLVGPGLVSGLMMTLRQVDANTVEVTETRNGVPMLRRTMVVSDDGKTLTATTVNLAPNASHEPSIDEWDKE